jgi:hypothetical protein
VKKGRARVFATRISAMMVLSLRLCRFIATYLNQGVGQRNSLMCQLVRWPVGIYGAGEKRRRHLGCDLKTFIFHRFAPSA